MELTRRKFFEIAGMAMGAITGSGMIFVGCTQNSSSPTAPTSQPPVPTPTPQPTMSTLLSRVQSQGYNAVRVPFGNNGAARISINSSINWNFYVDDNLVGLGGSAPTIDDSTILVLSTSSVSVHSV